MTGTLRDDQILRLRLGIGTFVGLCCGLARGKKHTAQVAACMTDEPPHSRRRQDWIDFAKRICEQAKHELDCAVPDAALEAE